MSIFVIADLHLSFKNPKPMDIFGDNWTKHEEKIKKDKIDIEKMQEIMDSLEETENIGTDDAIFKWIDNLDLEEEEKEIQ